MAEDALNRKNFELKDALNKLKYEHDELLKLEDEHAELGKEHKKLVEDNMKLINENDDNIRQVNNLKDFNDDLNENQEKL